MYKTTTVNGTFSHAWCLGNGAQMQFQNKVRLGNSKAVFGRYYWANGNQISFEKLDCV